VSEASIALSSARALSIRSSVSALALMPLHPRDDVVEHAAELADLALESGIARARARTSPASAVFSSAPRHLERAALREVADRPLQGVRGRRHRRAVAGRRRGVQRLQHLRRMVDEQPADVGAAAPRRRRCAR
jgi:hypothetical protein